MGLDIKIWQVGTCNLGLTRKKVIAEKIDEERFCREGLVKAMRKLDKWRRVMAVQKSLRSATRQSVVTQKQHQPLVEPLLCTKVNSG